MRIETAAENAVICYTDHPPGEHSLAQLSWLGEGIRARLGSGLKGLVPSYQSLLIVFDPLQTDHTQVRQQLQSLIAQPPRVSKAHPAGKLVRLPVYYSPETGPDLMRIAEHHRMKAEEVITAHCLNIYRVYAIGFAPGFAYLGEVDERIAMPRLADPRARVARGSVGIADRQTAIYPADSPGGWNIIGNCPSPMFTLNAEPPMPISVGDRVQFMPIREEEFRYLGGQI